MTDKKAENYKVRILRDKETGFRVSEVWTLNGQLHREEGPADRSWDAKTGNLVYERYCLREKDHREDGPSYVTYHPETGTIVSETWARHGAYQREGDLPSFWIKDEDSGHIIHEEYYWFGLKHRDSGPSEIQRDPTTGEVVYEAYYDHGDLISETKPTSPDSLDI